MSSYWFNRAMCNCDVVIFDGVRDANFGGYICQSVEVKFNDESKGYSNNYSQIVPCFMLKKL